jgi:hypothetical protein
VSDLRRTFWRGHRLNHVASEPLLVSLLKYRAARDRDRVQPAYLGRANLVSSLTESGRQAPIIDLDVPHHYVKTETPGHAHLYLNYEIPRWRWLALMIGLRLGGALEVGTFWWSLRRGANFVRPAGHRKTEAEKRDSLPVVPYGLVRRLR